MIIIASDSHYRSTVRTVGCAPFRAYVIIKTNIAPEGGGASGMGVQ
jgi:hypothetical protein